MSLENRRSLVGPLILITLGIILLLNNLGITDWNLWDLIFRFWPVILIACGIEILFGRRSSIGPIIGIIVAVAIITGVLSIFPRPTTNSSLVSREISQPLNGATEAEIEIFSRVSQLNLSALPNAPTPLNDAKLITGAIKLWQNEYLDENYNVQNSLVQYSLKSKDGAPFPWNRNKSQFEPTWVLQINPSIPTALAVKTGIGKTVLDLTGTSVTRLEVKVGVGETQVTLPSTGDIEAEIKGGVGKSEVIIPKGMAARIEVSKGIGAVFVPERFSRRDHRLYQSDGFDTADHRIDLEVKGGVGEIRIIDNNL